MTQRPITCTDVIIEFFYMRGNSSTFVQKLYPDVMMEKCSNLVSVDHSIPNPDIIVLKQ